MPSDGSASNDELEIDTIEDESADDQSTETAELDLDVEDNSTEDTSDSELTPAEKSAKQQIDSWYAKVVAGKADVADAPSWMQAKLSQKLEVIEKVPDVEKIIEEKLAQKEEQKQFKALLDTIPALPKLKAELLKAKFKEYKPLGNYKALETALAITGINADESKREARGRMSLPPSGRPAEKKQDDVLAIARDEKKWAQFQRNGYKL